MKFFIGIILTLFCFPTICFSTYFEDHPYFEYTGPAKEAIGRIICGPFMGTAVHIGEGKILAASHLGHTCERFISSDDMFRLPLQPLFCHPELDFCIHELKNPRHKRILKTHLNLSLRKPISGEEVIMMGFPADSPFELTSSIGHIIDGPITYAIENDHLPNVYSNTVSFYTGGSNSPVMPSYDHSVMILFENIYGVDRSDGEEKNCEMRADTSIQHYDPKRPTSNQWLFNYGVSAESIAQSLLNSQIRDEFCQGNNNSLYSCRRLRGQEEIKGRSALERAKRAAQKACDKTKEHYTLPCGTCEISCEVLSEWPWIHIPWEAVCQWKLNI